jgi:hypothetical protein
VARSRLTHLWFRKALPSVVGDAVDSAPENKCVGWLLLFGQIGCRIFFLTNVEWRIRYVAILLGSPQGKRSRLSMATATGRQAKQTNNANETRGKRLRVSHAIHREIMQMTRENVFVGILTAGCFVATFMLMPSVGHAQADPRVTKSMETLKAMTAKLGAPKLEGKEAVGSKDAPALYFGTTKINNNFDIVDAVGKQDGKGMTATLFVKGGDEYIRVSTSVPKPDGSGRAIGTVLTGPALESIKVGKAYYGEVPILGTPYITGYEPIKDSSGAEIGVYYVGYKK